jgi:hypothetical protein
MGGERCGERFAVLALSFEHSLPTEDHEIDLSHGRTALLGSTKTTSRHVERPVKVEDMPWKSSPSDWV